MSMKNKIVNWLTSDLQQDESKAIAPGMIANHQDKQAVWSEWSTENAIQHGMKSSTYVYACVDRLMKSASSVPWNAYIRNADGEWDEAHDHPLERLIQQPNPFMSRQQLIEIMTSHLYLGGNALLQKIKVRGTTVELYPIMPDLIKPVPSKINYLQEYQYEKGTDKKTFKPDEIAHFMFTDPSNSYWGISPLMAGAKTVDTDVEAVEWNKVALQNRAITDGVFSFDNVMTQSQWDEARKQVREQHQGTKNARTPWVLGSGAKWNQMSLSPVEMDFMESRKMSRTEICSIFQVPPPMVGIYDDATLANIETARKIFWVDTIIPFLDKLQDTFNRTLAKEFSMDGKEVWIGYDISNVQALQENLGEKIENAQSLWNMGVPFNVINERLELGFDDIEGGNSGYLGMGLMPTSFKPDEQEEEIIDQIEEDDKSKKKEVKFFNLNDEQKATHWKAVDGRRQKWETKVAAMVGKRFREEGSKVMKAYENGSQADALRAVDLDTKEWNKLFTAFYVSVMEDFGDETGQSIMKSSNSVRETKFEFNPFETGVQDWIKMMVGRNIKGIGKTTKDMVKREISSGVENGETSTTIAKRLQGAYKHFDRVRSHVIARTEVGSAMNAGTDFAARQTGLEYDKVWLSSGDDRTRDSHDGIADVPKGEPFNVDGSLMMFPGDSSMGADADEIVNCRCVETFEVRRR